MYMRCALTIELICFLGPDNVQRFMWQDVCFDVADNFNASVNSKFFPEVAVPSEAKRLSDHVLLKGMECVLL